MSGRWITVQTATEAAQLRVESTLDFLQCLQEVDAEEGGSTLNTWWALDTFSTVHYKQVKATLAS